MIRYYPSGARKLRAFAHERRGAAAVEMAIVISLLALSTSMLIDVKFKATAYNQMTASLNASANYIMHGGTDLARLQRIFENNYGAPVQNFSTALVCSAPFIIDPEQGDEDAQATNFEESMTVRHDKAQSAPGVWNECQGQGTGVTLRFLEIAATDMSTTSVTGAQTEISAKLRIRLATDEI